MDWMTFIVELVRALAWPAVVAMAVWFFKDKLTKLFDDVTEVRGLGIEATFARGVKDVRAEVAAIEEEVVVEQPAPLNEAAVLGGPENTERVDDFVDLSKYQMKNMLYATLEPRAAILDARSKVEQAIKDFADESLVTGTSGGTILGLLRGLKMQGFIRSTVLLAGKDLIALGNKAAHDPFVPSVESARDYVNAANSFVRVLFSSKRSS